MVEAIKKQAETLTTIAPTTANLTRGEAAERITDIAPVGFNKVFFTNAGADAVENAIRMARIHTGRDKVLSTYRSYHGNTGAAIVATGDWRRIPNEYARGHVHFFGPYLYRSEFWATTPEQEAERALQHLRRVIESEGPASIAAILLETIPGTAGIMIPPPGYLPGVRALADEFGIMLILDEVMAGFGRTGEWLALDAYDVVPDLITFAKGVNSGYVPAGGVIISDPVAADLRRPGLPRWAHLLRPPARDGVDRGDHRGDGRGGHRRQRRDDRHRPHRPRPRLAGREARRDRRGTRHRGLLGPRARRRPRDAGAAAGRRRWAGSSPTSSPAT